MREATETNEAGPTRAGFKVFAFAAAYAAFVVSIIVFFGYGGSSSGIGNFAATIAFLTAFLCALALSPVFAALRPATNELVYFLMHLVTGMAIGAALASNNQYALEWHQYVWVPIALTVIAASLAAWLFVFLLTSPGDPPTYRSDGWKVLSFWTLPLACIVFPIPALIAEVPTDPSCHNALRGERTRASPSMSAKFNLTEDEGANIGALYDRFAAAQALSVRRHARLPDSESRSFCNDDVVFKAGGVFDGGRHSLTVYPHENAGDWRPLAAALICDLEKNLDSGIRFTGGGGEDIERPDFLLDSCRRQELSIN